MIRSFLFILLGFGLGLRLRLGFGLDCPVLLTGLVFRIFPRVLHFILGESPSSADQADMRGGRRYSSDDPVIGHLG